jgi:thiamine-phosphate pyrophosphorylase
MIALDPFYPIADSAEWVGRLVTAGARLIQLRMKEKPDVLVRLAIRRSLTICRRHEAQLVVNDYWRVAIDEHADYIHLGQGDLDGADITAIRAKSIRIGISTHSHEELDRALAFDPDYIALGPVYPTTLKVMPWKPQGLERIGAWKRLIGKRPLVAIGGITLERAPGCLAAGADIVSAVSDITGNPHPEARARAWIAATRPKS